MNYNQAIEFIHSLNKFGIKPGLERITALLNQLGNPQKDLNVVHIAGTNGKGSTSTAISNILIAEGKKTGLFISPYVIQFEERIQVNGQYISKGKLAEFTEKVAKTVPKVEAALNDNVTEFEFITALAFLYFKEQNCDAVVLEVGLGGRLDSTNVIETPLASVITKIALDHTAVLGNTVEEIALEKCGIIKKRCPVITSSLQNPTAFEVITKTAHSSGADLYIANMSDVSNLSLGAYGSTFTYNGLNISVNLAGRHQVENMITAAQTAKVIGISAGAIEKGIASTFFPARLEIFSKSPPVILDGAHNENGADVLADYLDENKLKPVMIIGMMADKNCDAVLKKLASRALKVVTVKVLGNPRSQTAEDLANQAKRYCDNVVSVVDYETALKQAGDYAKSVKAPLVICGSLYLASDIRNLAINYFKN